MAKKYKIIAGLFCAVVVLTLLFHWFVTRPKLAEVRYDEDIVEQNQARMRSRGWPTDAANLEQRLANERHEMAGLRQRAGELMERLNQTFADTIQEEFEDIDKFMMHASRLDYKELFAEVDEQFKSLNVNVTPQSLKLNEASPAVYPLIIQLWTLRDLVGMALASGLEIAQRPVDVAAGESDDVDAEPEVIEPLSDIEFKGVIAYSNALDGATDDAPPFLLEFPVTLTATGSIEAVMRFIQQLQAPDRLYSTNHLEIRTVPPSIEQPNTTLVQVNMECSAFFLLQRDLGALGL